jgi:hypothetical protein
VKGDAPSGLVELCQNMRMPTLVSLTVLLPYYGQKLLVPTISTKAIAQDRKRIAPNYHLQTIPYDPKYFGLESRLITACAARIFGD